jgi:acyl-CoA synthetase (NDP forming)
MTPGPLPVDALDRFFKPRAIVIVGLSRDALDGPVSVFSTLKGYGYEGAIHIVNPNLAAAAVEGIYASLDALPEGVDLAIIVLARQRVLGALEDCVRNGIRAAIVITQGFADADADGVELQRRIVDLTKRHDIRVLGPNTMGLSNAFAGFTSSFIEMVNVRVPVGLISQSGLFMMGHHIINNVPAGFGMAVDIGNACDIGLIDILAYYEQAPEIAVIQCHVESIVDGRRFLEVAGRVARHKPIIIHKSGTSRTGRIAAASHSGAAAGENEVYRAAFRKAGLISVDNVEDLRILTKAFVTYSCPRGKRVAVISFSGGAAVLAVDALEARGLTLAKLSPATQAAIGSLFPSWMEVGNPLDVWIAVSKSFHSTYPRLFELLLQDEGVDSVICIYPSFTMPKYEAYDSSRHIRHLAEAFPEKPILCWSYGLDVEGFSEAVEAGGRAMVFPSLDAAAATIAAMADYRAFRPESEAASETGQARPTAGREAAGRILAAAKAAGRRHLFADALRILDAYGIKTAPWRLVPHVAGLAAAAAEIGFPLCLKVVSDEIVHKSDVGGVVLGIPDLASLVESHRRLMAAVQSQSPEARVEGVLLQAMAPRGKEVMIGAKRDPVFGQCLVLGAGGIYTEIFQDHVFRLAPVGQAEGWRMLEELRFSRILKGARGETACDMQGIVDVLLRVSQLLTDYPVICELDINPVMVTGSETIAVDARMIL